MPDADQTNLLVRRRAYAALSSRLAHMDDRRLRSTLKSARMQAGPWGTSYAADVDGSKVFVKRIPLTELEASRRWSTRNHFRLPPYYNYGFGSAGFGVYRELVAHIITTNWVLEGASPSFPMLLHHRMMARTETHRPDGARIEQYVKRWNGSRAVGELMRARAAAPQEVWLVLEHVPYVMSEWVMTSQDRAAEVIDQLFAAISLMRRNGMVHFDVHFGNVLTDGETVYLADFGLLNDTNFELTKPERSFLARHNHYDYGEAIFAAGLAPMWALWSHPEASRPDVLRAYPWLHGIERQREFAAAVIDNLDKMTAGPLAIAPLYAELLRRYRDAILHMAGFFDAMWSNPPQEHPVRRRRDQAAAGDGRRANRLSDQPEVLASSARNVFASLGGAQASHPSRSASLTGFFVAAFSWIRSAGYLSKCGMVKKPFWPSASTASFSCRSATRTAKIAPAGGSSSPKRLMSALLKCRSQAKTLPATDHARVPCRSPSSTSGSSNAMRPVSSRLTTPATVMAAAGVWLRQLLTRGRVQLES